MEMDFTRPRNHLEYSRIRNSSIDSRFMWETIVPQSLKPTATSAFIESSTTHTQRPTTTPYQSRNRYGRPYISGRPLLTCDRQKIVQLYETGMKKIHIAKQLGITHSCVSKILKKYQDTGVVESKSCREPQCSCKGIRKHMKFCRHIRAKRLMFSIEKLPAGLIYIIFLNLVIENIGSFLSMGISANISTLRCDDNKTIRGSILRADTDYVVYFSKSIKTHS
ncbi:paired box' domain protein [Dictyocaulus viviparus]|uniref:Paired box' domain protein n=1 Tax=Dictyocaulus viviparus TaxID=29172 RepID=A0A0D8XDR7_DICVI|nr:paired box' domain protein [Dictyocaulus viviparus]